MWWWPLLSRSTGRVAWSGTPVSALRSASRHHRGRHLVYGAVGDYVLRLIAAGSDSGSGRGAGSDAGRVAAAAGVAGTGRRPHRGAGRGCVAGARLGGLEDGLPLARSIAMVAAPLFLALVLHLLLAFPDGSPRSASARLAVRGVYAAVGIASVGWALVHDPRLDPHCWSNCTDDSFLLSAQPAVARGLETAGIVLALGLGTGIVAICAGRLARGTGTARRFLAPVLLPGLMVGASAAAQAIALLRTPLEGPEFAVFSALFQAAGVVGRGACGGARVDRGASAPDALGGRAPCLRPGGRPSSGSPGSRAGQGDE